MVGLGSQASEAVTLAFAGTGFPEVIVVFVGSPFNTGGLVSLILMNRTKVDLLPELSLAVHVYFVNSV